MRLSTKAVGGQPNDILTLPCSRNLSTYIESRDHTLLDFSLPRYV